MKRRRPWLRWLALGLCVEASLWIFTKCRPFSDWQKRYPATNPVLVDTGGEMLLIESTPIRIASGPASGSSPADLRCYDALRRLLVSRQPARHARRTREGQLLDDHGRVLLDYVGEWSKFAYAPNLDLLVWINLADNEYTGLNIRFGGVTRRVATWNVENFQIRPNGQIWLAESLTSWSAGISVLDAKGNFLGWRTRDTSPFLSGFCELNAVDMAQVEALRKRRDKEEK